MYSYGKKIDRHLNLLNIVKTQPLRIDQISTFRIKDHQFMTLEHVAIWTNQLETLKEYYIKYFGGKSNNKYSNSSKDFHSYFLSFESGARLELMYMPAIPANQNDTIKKQHLGIIHLAFGVKTIQEVEEKATQLQADGFPVLSGPRKTGDGYYEFETLDPDNNRIEVTALYPLT
jgi:lactoylglutathione lyase